jgi:outer membrane receptor protein involved in Fe transport
MILRLALASLLLSSGVSAAANAQSREAVAEETGEAGPCPAGAGTPQARAEWNGIEEIVVQARKRAELLEDTPISITALTRETQPLANPFGFVVRYFEPPRSYGGEISVKWS